MSQSNSLPLDASRTDHASALRGASVLLALTCVGLPACGGQLEGGEAGAAPASRAPTLSACPGIVRASEDRAPRNARTLAAGNRIATVALTDNDVLFTNIPADFAKGPLRSVPKAGGELRVIADVMAHGIALTPDRMIFGTGATLLITDLENTPRSSVFHDVFDFALDGDKIFTTSLKNQTVESLDIDGNPIAVLASGRSAPQGVSVYAGYVYWADYASKSAWRIPRDGGAPENLGTFDTFTRSVVADCHYAYISVGNYGEETWRVPLEGSDRTPSLLAPVGGAMVLDTMSLYVENSQGMWRVALSDGEVTDLGPGTGAQGSYRHPLAVDESAVYWSTGSQLMRADK
jgi:hypothetical protein